MNRLLFILLLCPVLALGQGFGTYADQQFIAEDASTGGFSCATSNLWSTPILQQQLLNNDYANFLKTSWVKQKIHNTSSTAVILRKVNLRIGEVGGVNCDAYVFIEKTNQVANPIPDLGSYTATNAILANAAYAVKEFIWTDANAPTIPANTDFFVVLKFDSAGAGNLSIRQSTANPYEGSSYNGTGGSDLTATVLDFYFEIYVCQ